MSAKTAAPSPVEERLEGLALQHETLNRALLELGEVAKGLIAQFDGQEERLQRLEAAVSGLVDAVAQIGTVVEQIVRVRRL
jgi:hypothetical protein